MESNKVINFVKHHDFNVSLCLYSLDSMIMLVCLQYLLLFKLPINNASIFISHKKLMLLNILNFLKINV